MKVFAAAAAVLALVAPFVHAQDVPIGAANALISYSPAPGAGSWASIPAPGAFNGSGEFLLGQTDKGVITFSPPQAFTAFQFFGYQRSDGGIYSITFDGASAHRIDVFNATSQGTDGPLLLFSVSGLTNQPHKVVIQNLNDARVGHPGQMNIDHIVITTAAAAPAPVSTTSASTPTPTLVTTPVATPAPLPSTTSSAPVVPASTATVTSTDDPVSQPDVSSSPEVNDPSAASSLRAAPLFASAAAAALLAFAI